MSVIRELHPDAVVAVGPKQGRYLGSVKTLDTTCLVLIEFDHQSRAWVAIDTVEPITQGEQTSASADRTLMDTAKARLIRRMTGLRT